MNPFLQLAADKKDLENSATRKIFWTFLFCDSFSKYLRYITLVSELTHFDAETFRSNSSNESRGNVHVKIESPRHKFGKPVAGNFFYVVWNHTKGKHFLTARTLSRS